MRGAFFCLVIITSGAFAFLHTSHGQKEEFAYELKRIGEQHFEIVLQSAPNFVKAVAGPKESGAFS